MAQVKVYGLRPHLLPVRAVLSDAIHAAVVAAFAYPAGKRFHRFFHLEREDFVFPADRSDRYTILEISVFEGRSVEAKKALIRELCARIPAATGILPADLEITITETPRHAWGIRGMPGDEIGLDYKVEV
jgi:phenylpyruvate tautomerase PptA (4-oxalocrotonate tautomerase family)